MSFRHLTPEQRTAISRKGGQAAQAKGVAHRWTAEEARKAGRKGGIAVHAKRRAENERDEKERGQQ